MKWIKINDSRLEIPRDGSEFLAIWKGIVCIAQFDEDEGRYYITFQPAVYPGNSRIPQEREVKFTHWMPLPETPD